MSAWESLAGGNREDLEALAADEARVDPLFSTFVEAGTAAAGTWLKAAEKLAGYDGGSRHAEDLAEALGGYATAARTAQPFLGAAPFVAFHLRGSLLQALEAAGTQDSEGAAERLVGERDSPAARESRRLYRVVHSIARNPEARDLVLDLSPGRAARSLEADFPEIHDLLTRHLQDHGWVRTFAFDEPLTARQVLQRSQVALLRWDQPTIEAAAADPAEVDVGPLPDPEGRIRELAERYRTVTGATAFSSRLPLKAHWVARSFFALAATVLDCPPALLRHSGPDEILAALRDGALPQDEISHRGPAGRVELAGQSVALGRSVGRVRVILDADDGGRLGPGDVLVTGLSTPNYEGQTSVFPYRGIAAVSVDRTGAVVTDEGGLLSHAAIICRENQVPCILGTEGATETLADGAIVEVDATRATGTVTVLQE